MSYSKVKTNSLKAWILAARPKTLSGAAVPVMIGTAIAWAETTTNNFQVIQPNLPVGSCLLQTKQKAFFYFTKEN